MPRPQQKKGLCDKKTPEEKAAKGKNQARLNFVCLLTSSLVYQWCVSEEQSRPSAAESSVVSYFCSAAGDQRVGETEGNNRLRERRRRRGESRTEGICWIISLQCCSIDLRMDPHRQRALVSHPFRCRSSKCSWSLCTSVHWCVHVRLNIIYRDKNLALWESQCEALFEKDSASNFSKTIYIILQKAGSAEIVFLIRALNTPSW